MDADMLDRIRGCAVGAAVGDALGMPLEFGPQRSADALVREMLPGRIPAGRFTDDTEMALALAESLLAHRPLDPADLARRFVAWYHVHPPDIGVHTLTVLGRIARGELWETAVNSVQRTTPDAAGNGAVMRCWPAALVWRNDLERLIADSVLQSRVTHPHVECTSGSAFVNAAIFHLIRGTPPAQAVAQALLDAKVPDALRAVIEAAPTKKRAALPNTGWVRHTLESAIWGLLSTDSFEGALVNVVNLGDDTDTAGTVMGALAGAAYGLSSIPARWRDMLQGEFPLGSGRLWRAVDFAALADQLAALTDVASSRHVPVGRPE